MTSQEIKSIDIGSVVKKAPTSESSLAAHWTGFVCDSLILLREIAYQLAVSNELEQKRHEENLRQRDEFLTGNTTDRDWYEKQAVEIADEILNQIGHSSSKKRDRDLIVMEMQQYAIRFALAHPQPGKADERNPSRTAAALRSCAQTIQENDMDRKAAVDYLLKYAEAVISHETTRYGENLNPHLTRVDSADITCPNCARPFWVHVSMVGPWNPPAAKES